MSSQVIQLAYYLAQARARARARLLNQNISKLVP